MLSVQQMEKPRSIVGASDDVANIVASIRRTADAVVNAGIKKEAERPSNKEDVDIFHLLKVLTELTAVSHAMVDMQEAYNDYIEEKDETQFLDNIVESENEEQRAQAEAVKTTKLARLRNMSHELRTPLTAIIGLAEMLDAEAHGSVGNEKYANYISDILDAARHLLSQLERLLEAASAEANKVQPNWELIQVRPAIERAVEIVSGFARGHEIEVHANFSDSLSCIWFDESRLTRVIIGVLENAIKYSKRNGVVSVDVKNVDQSMITVRITDRGAGMDEDAISGALSHMHAADPFYVDERRGLGVGIAYAKKIIELQGGTLRLQSEIDKGTIVTILLATNTHPQGMA